MNPPDTKPLFKLASPDAPSPFELKEREKRRCCADILPIGAKLLYCWLADNSWMRCFGGEPGGSAISISVSQLQQWLRVGERSISRWTSLLIERGYLWLGKKPIRNSHAQNVYHLSVSEAPPGDGTQMHFDTWGNPYRHADGRYSKVEPFAEVPANTASLPSTGPPSTANVAVGHGQRGGGPRPTRPRAGANQAVGHGQRGGGPRPTRRRATANVAVGHGQVGGPKESPESASGVGEAVKTVSPAKERLKVNGEGENDFMLECLQLFGKKTGEDWGGYWRTLYRQNSGKARRVIAAVREDLASKSISNPGGYALDLWKRFAD